MKFVLVFCLTVFLFISLISCDTSEPLPQGAVGLSLEDVSCTEAWITLTAGNLSNTAYIRVLGNGKLLETLDVNATKTTLYFDTLQPNTTYEFQALASQRGEEIVGNKLQFTTLDTTSHNFTLQTFTFGQHSSSTLYDVAIINENDIWAVGEIYMNDSLGFPDPACYNAMHWNGQSWELKKIKTNACGGVVYPPIKAIFTFSSNDILFAHIDGSISHFNGIEFKNDCSLITQLNGSANKIWGISKNDFYVVSVNGFIAHYNGNSWTKIESGTTTNINDIWGVIDQSNNQQIVYGAVSFVAQTGDQKILKIQNNKVDSLHWNTGRRVHSVWTFNNRFLCAAGGGIFENKRGYWNEITEVPLYYSRNIRGTGNNNIFVCGDFGLLSHFNGLAWVTYNEHYMQGILFSVAIKNNTIVTVGLKGNKAIVIKGERN